MIKNPGIRDFRDPKVFWYDKGKKWIMTLAAGQETQFYESKNLKKWDYFFSFGNGIGNHKGVWECPDFFELPVLGTTETKWVHLVSISPGGPNGGSATQYFIGDFNGKEFLVDPDFEAEMGRNHNFWTDFGKDNYAGVTYSNWRSKNSGVLYQGWMSNWQYANKVPTNTWRGAMTIPREFELFKSERGVYRIRSKNLDLLDKYVTKSIEVEKIDLEENTLLIPANKLNFSCAKGEFEIQNIEDETYTFIFANKKNDSLRFGYDHKKMNFFIDRNKSGIINFSKNFALKPSLAPRLKTDSNLKIEFILDKSSIEIFYDNGITVMTEIIFPNAPYETLTLLTSGKKVSLKNFKVEQINK